MKWIEKARETVKSQKQNAAVNHGHPIEESEEYDGIIIEETADSNDENDVEAATYIEEHEGEVGDDDYIEEMEIEWLHK